MGALPNVMATDVRKDGTYLPPPIVAVDGATYEGQRAEHSAAATVLPETQTQQGVKSVSEHYSPQTVMEFGEDGRSTETALPRDPEKTPLPHSQAGHTSLPMDGSEAGGAAGVPAGEEAPVKVSAFRKVWNMFAHGDTELADMEKLRKELDERKWKDPSPFKYKTGELCSMLDPENFDELESLGGIDAVLSGLGTSTETGLLTGTTEKSAHALGTLDDRTRVYGANVLPERKSKSLLMLMWLALHDKILILLIVAAIVSLALGLYTDFAPPPEYTPCMNPPPGMSECEAPAVDWVEGVAILVAVVIVDLVGSLNDWQKERQFRVLEAKKDARLVTVLRDGSQAQVDVHDVVVGDIVSVEPGEVVAFDGIVVRAHSIRCDESSVTGESDMIQKITYDEYREARAQESVKHKSVFMISGSKVLEGVGEFVVTAVGPFSMHGKLMMSLRQEPENTPLQKKLNRLAELIAKLGTAAGVLMFIALMIRFFVNYGRDPSPDSREYGCNFMNILIISVTVIVVAVPEGLPLAVTLALAFATRRMSERNLLVRVLGSCKTMANATCVCTDKTGTLTQNNMNVVAGCVGSDLVFLDQIKRETVDAQADDAAVDLAALTEHVSEPVRRLLTDLICINSTAFVPTDAESEEKVATAHKKKPWWARLFRQGASPESKEVAAATAEAAFVGSKTETALLNLVRRLQWGDYEALRRAANVVQVVPFSSKRKAMGVVVQTEHGYRFFVKGASEIMLRDATSTVQASSLSPVEMTDALRQEFSDTIEKYASQSLRTMGLCYRDFESWPPPGMEQDASSEVSFDDLAQDLTLLSIMAIEDPLRQGVPEAVRACLHAGVRVKMCTGDNLITASSIGQQCGIYTPGGVAIEGPAFRQLSQADLQALVPNLNILARSSPEDKKTLIDTLKSMGETVAVTGDGTNDGPALKAAHVGFSMGIAGSEVAKEASDIILLDDNFSSIVNAIMWGRCVNDAVRKFLQFQLTVNVVAVVLTFVSSVSNSDQESVLTAVQLLWLNLIMDTLAALALATDPADPSSLDRQPDSTSTPLVTVEMWKQIIVQSIYQVVLLFVLYYRGMDILNTHSPERAVELVHNLDLDTLIFNTFVWCQLFNQVNARRLDRHINIFHGFFKNIWFILIMIIEIGCQVLIIYVGGAAFSVKRLNGRDWGISIVAGFISWPLGMLTRMLPTKPFERLLVKLRLVPDPNALPVVAPEKTESVEPFADWNEPAIGQIAKQIGSFSRIRGGRLRASNLVLKGNARLMREENVHPHEIMAIVPAIVGTSFVGMWKNTGGDESQQGTGQVVKVPASTLFQQGKIRFHPSTPADHPYLKMLQGAVV